MKHTKHGTLRPRPNREAHTELDNELANLRTLVEQLEIVRAREMVQRLRARWPDAPRVTYWAEVLEPPKVSVRADSRVRPLDEENEWLRRNAHKYPGRWLAVLGGNLIAADPKLSIVRAKVQAHPGGKSALLHFQPGPQSSK